jgi:hypothetical protein
MFCPKCGSQNSDSAGFCASCGNPLKPAANTGGNFGTPPPPPSNPNFSSGTGVKPKNWMTEAIIVTVAGFIFSCLGGILGIIAIVNASNVDKKYQQGDFVGAENAAKQAKLFTIIAAVVAALGLLFSIVVYGGAILSNL